MKTYISLLAFGLTFGTAIAVGDTAHAGVLDDEYVKPEVTASAPASTPASSPESAAAANGEQAPSAEPTAEQKEAKSACEASADKAGVSGAAKAERCKSSDYATATPTGSGAIMSAQPTSAKQAMFSTSLTGEAAPAGTGFKTLAVTKQDVSQQLGNLNPDMMNTSSVIKSNTKLTNTVEGNAVKTASIDPLSYRNAQGKATVVVGGGNTLGFDPRMNRYQNMRGGSIIWDDSLILTDVETARAVRMGQSDMSPQGTNYQGFNQSVAAPKGLRLNSSQLEMAAYIDARGRDLGLSEDVRRVAIATAMRESRFDSMVNANCAGAKCATGGYRKYVDSSAYGLGQYINGTWVNNVNKGIGGGINRNNTTNQIDMLYGDINSRYQKYSASSSMQKKYSFAEYDYIHHYAGGFNASPDRIAHAVTYTRKNSSANNAVANYVMNGNENGTSGAIKAGGQKIPTWVESNNNGGAYGGKAGGAASNGGNYTPGATGGTGGGTEAGTGAGAAAGGGGSTSGGATGGGNAGGYVAGLITAATGGDPTIGALTQQILGGGTVDGSTAQGMLASLAAQQVMQQLNGGGTSGGNSGGNSKSGSEKGGSGSSSSGETKLTGEQLLRAQSIADMCGDSLPSTRESLMLMVKTCQERKLI